MPDSGIAAGDGAEQGGDAAGDGQGALRGVGRGCTGHALATHFSIPKNVKYSMEMGVNFHLLANEGLKYSNKLERFKSWIFCCLCTRSE